MTKQNKPSPSLGKYHQASLKRNDYNKPPEAAKGFPNSTPGYSGPVTIMKDGKEPKK